MRATITGQHRIYVIAEIGVNHNGDMDLARASIDAAVLSGADAVKFQMYKTEELVTRSAEKAEYQRVNLESDDLKQWDMLKSLELTQKQHVELSRYCKQLGIDYICTAYDIESAKFLVMNTDIAALKIASTDTTNIPLLNEIDGLDCQVILSTGMCSMPEVELALQSLSEVRKSARLTILQCTSEYPTPLEQANLRAIGSMADKFNCPVGFSDHTEGSEAAVLAAAAGACLIEKHFTLNKDFPGPDHAASSTPDEFSALVSRLRHTEIILGDGVKRIVEAESRNKCAMQKSIYWRSSKEKGDLVSMEDLSFKRPAIGMKPAEIDLLLGKKLVKAVCADVLVQVEDVI